MSPERAIDEFPVSSLVGECVALVHQSVSSHRGMSTNKIDA